jgi:hypothetical protein
MRGRGSPAVGHAEHARTPYWEKRGQSKSKAGLPASPRRQLQNHGHPFAAARQKTTEMGLEVGIGDVLATCDFVFREQLAPQQLDYNQGGDEHGFK